MAERALILVEDGEQRSTDQRLAGVDEDTGDALELIGGAASMAGSLAGSSSGGNDAIPLDMSGGGGGFDASSAASGISTAAKVGSGLSSAVGSEEGSKASNALAAGAKGLALGASLGAAMGTAFPVIGTAIGTVVGAVGGFIAGMVMEITKKRALTGPEKAMFARAEVDPSMLADAFFYTYNRPLYDSLRGKGQLPSQKIEALAKAGKLNKKAHNVALQHGLTLKQVAAEEGHTQAERALLGVGALAGSSAAMADTIRIARSRQQMLKNIRLNVPRSTAPVGGGEGLEQAQVMPADERPEPAYHMGGDRLPRRIFEGLVRLVPATRSLPRSQLEAIVGLRGVAQDVAGVDAVDQSYVAEPGETARDIARKLVSDERRAAELTAANPGHRRDDPRWWLPPGWFQFSAPFVVAEFEDTGKSEDSEDDEPPIIAEPLPSAEPKGPTPIVPDEPLPMELPEVKVVGSKPAPAPAQKSKSPRPQLTKRVVKTLGSDWPQNIAKRLGAWPASPTWWKEFKAANPHKPTKDGGGNWETLWGGEILNVPDSWPASAFALPAPGGVLPVPAKGQIPIPVGPSPLPGGLPSGLPSIPGAPAVPGNLPAILGGATADPGVIGRAQLELAGWSKLNPGAADPKDFGQALPTLQVPFSPDLSGVLSERTTRATKAFQVWRNANAATSLRTDGTLDAPTVAALDAWAAEAAASNKLPSGLPGGLPPAGGQSIPAPVPGGLPGGLPSGVPIPSAKPAESGGGGGALAVAAAIAAALGGWL